MPGKIDLKLKLPFPFNIFEIYQRILKISLKNKKKIKKKDFFLGKFIKNSHLLISLKLRKYILNLMNLFIILMKYFYSRLKAKI